MAIHCDYCMDEIKYQRDLIVTSTFFTFNTYHAECYGLMSKEGRFFLGQPINSNKGNAAPVIFVVIYLFALLSSAFRSEPLFHYLLIFLILSSLYTRLYSYYKFEKKL